MIKVLLADDHQVLCDGLYLIIEAQEDMHVVSTCCDGCQALERCCETCPDIAIIDIAMPEMNGLDATREITRKCPDTRVIILSMYTTAGHLHQALSAGAQGYLFKGSAGQEIVEAIRTVDASDRYLSRAVSNILIDDYLAHDKGEEEDQGPLGALTPRERQVLQQIAEGNPVDTIARKLFISPKTVYTHRTHIMEKLGLKTLPELIRVAMNCGLTPGNC